MVKRMRQGAVSGGLLALLVILSQPFHPARGLVLELVTFLTTIPLWIAAMIFQNRVTPLIEGGVVLAYFIVIGGLLGVAFEQRRLWGWLFLLALVIHHYVVYDLFGRRMGEVVQTLLNYFT